MRFALLLLVPHPAMSGVALLCRDLLVQEGVSGAVASLRALPGDVAGRKRADWKPSSTPCGSAGLISRTWARLQGRVLHSASFSLLTQIDSPRTAVAPRDKMVTS